MPRTRSRPKTEAKFQDAVLELLSEGGCVGLGINSVAQRAGADKVLIYRYFGDMDGLLARVGEVREWLPSPVESVALAWPAGQSTGPEQVLRELCRVMVRYLEADAPSRQAMLWRRTNLNPLTRAFAAIWLGYWEAVANDLARGLDHDERGAWREACFLVAQVVEAEVSGDPVAPGVFSRIAAGLVSADPGPSGIDATPAGETDRLPTNLL